MYFYEINICQIMIYKLYSVYKKHNDDKNWRLKKRKIASIIASAQMILLPSATNNFFHMDTVIYK